MNKMNQADAASRIPEVQPPDIVALANDIMFRSYRISKMSFQKLFYNMTATDYVAIWALSRDLDDDGEKQKIYLEEIAAKLKLPMGVASKIARELQDRGLVQWKHDGNGEEGTYLQITDKGLNSAIEQQKMLKHLYKNVIERFGAENFVSLLAQLAELETILNDEITNKENEGGLIYND